MVIGVLTAGGDCPGLNAVTRAVVSRAVVTHGMEVVGVLNGWDGLMDGHVRPLGRDDVRGILQRGGTILGTSRRDPYVHGDGYASVRRTVEANGIDCRDRDRRRRDAAHRASHSRAKAFRWSASRRRSTTTSPVPT